MKRYAVTQNGHLLSKLYSGVGPAKSYLTSEIRRYKRVKSYDLNDIIDYKITEFELIPTDKDFSEFDEKKIKKAIIESKLEKL